MEETVIAYKVKFNYYFMLSAIYLILFGFMTCGVHTGVSGSRSCLRNPYRAVAAGPDLAQG